MSTDTAILSAELTAFGPKFSIEPRRSAPESRRVEVVDGMPFAEYQAAPGVSKSFLDEFARCPLAAYEYMTIGGEPATRAMVLGSAVDCLLCEPERFSSRFYVRPETYESDGAEKAWNGNSKVCREWLASHRNKPVLTADEVQQATEEAKAVLADPKAAKLLHDCRVQQSVFWVDKRTGLQLKGRPDFVGQGYAMDLKRIRDASEHSISRAIAEYRYYVQAAMYMDGLKANGVECEEFYFIFIEPGDRPKPNIRRLKQEAISLGVMVYNEQLLQVRDCMKRAIWPGFSGSGEDVLAIDVPAYTYTSNGGALTLKIGGEDCPI